MFTSSFVSRRIFKPSIISYSCIINPHPLDTKFKRFASTTIPPQSAKQLEQAQNLMNDAAKYITESKLLEAEQKYIESLNIVKSPTAFYNLGVVQAQRGHLHEAINSFKSSLEMKSQSDCHANIATCYLYLLQHDKSVDIIDCVSKAKHHLQEAFQLSPQDGEIAFNLGAALEASGELRQALEKYKKAKELGVESNKVDTLIRNVSAKILGKEAEEIESK